MLNNIFICQFPIHYFYYYYFLMLFLSSLVCNLVQYNDKLLLSYQQSI